MKNSLPTSCPFWQQEEYKLTLADVLYQMVGIFDDIKAFHSHDNIFEGHFDPLRLSKIGMAHPV